jgi:hypothetical protein
LNPDVIAEGVETNTRRGTAVARLLRVKAVYGEVLADQRAEPARERSTYACPAQNLYASQLTVGAFRELVNGRAIQQLRRFAHQKL